MFAIWPRQYFGKPFGMKNISSLWYTCYDSAPQKYQWPEHEFLNIPGNSV